MNYFIVLTEECNLNCSYCRGRCLYANSMMHWGRKGFGEVCGTVRHLVNEMKRARPDVRMLLKEGTVRTGDLGYTKFNSCEIIP